MYNIVNRSFRDKSSTMPIHVKLPSLSIVVFSYIHARNSTFHYQTAESWCPGWTISTVLVGLLSFMLENTSTTGSITTTDDEKRALAAASKSSNRANPKFKEIFPDVQ